MTLYDILIKLASDGYDKIHIDLEKKNLKVGKRTIIENAEVKQHKIKVYDNEYEFNELIENPISINVNELYKQYKYSSPSERDGGKHYFKALTAEELTDVQLVTGMARLEARIRLEAYILLYALYSEHLIIMPSNTNKWYWQGEDKDFVVLRKYFEI